MWGHLGLAAKAAHMGRPTGWGGHSPSLARAVEEGEEKVDSVSTEVSEFLPDWELRQIVLVGFLLVIHWSPSWTQGES